MIFHFDLDSTYLWLWSGSGIFIIFLLTTFIFIFSTFLCFLRCFSGNATSSVGWILYIEKWLSFVCGKQIKKVLLIKLFKFLWKCLLFWRYTRYTHFVRSLIKFQSYFTARRTQLNGFTDTKFVQIGEQMAGWAENWKNKPHTTFLFHKANPFIKCALIALSFKSEYDLFALWDADFQFQT